jgi:hypothetical protein
LKIGIVDQDKYLTHLRDAVLFPPKKGESEPIEGTYIRMVYGGQLKGNVGVFLLPMTKDKKIVLNIAFRHSIRAFTLEGAGTIAKAGESIEESAKRCMHDELGCEAVSITKLTDNFVPERGLLDGFVPIYAVEVELPDNAEVSDPTVRGHIALSKEEYLAAVKNGTYKMNGQTYIFNDGYTNTAVLLAMAHGLI